jgi:hypothetical protein
LRRRSHRESRRRQEGPARCAPPADPWVRASYLGGRELGRLGQLRIASATRMRSQCAHSVVVAVTVVTLTAAALRSGLAARTAHSEVRLRRGEGMKSHVL